MEISWTGLLKGELLLVFNVSLGLLLGMVLLRADVPGKLLETFRPVFVKIGIPPDIVAALAVSLGSSRAATAVVAASFESGRINRNEALFGTLLQAFPGYLRRWITSFAVAVGLAGTAGAVYSLILLARSFVRFLIFLFLLRREHGVSRTDGGSGIPEANISSPDLIRILKRTLPMACSFYAAAFIVAPWLHGMLERTSSVLPLMSPQGLTIVASSLAHVTAALGAAGGYLASGGITPSHAVLALLVGNLLGIVFRVFRQNIAFWVGLFPADMVKSLLFWHLITVVPLMILSIGIVGVFVFFV